MREVKRQWLNAVLKAKGLKPKDYAAGMGIDASTVSAMLNGHRAVSDDTVDSTCKLYGVRPPGAEPPSGSVNAAEITSAIRAMGDKLENVVTFVRLAMQKEGTGK